MEIWAPIPSTSSIGVFAILLSTGWLRERHINVFASYLAFKARGHVDRLWIRGLHLSVLLKALPEKPKWAEGAGKGLVPFERMFTEGGYKNLLFPANINDSHWILFSVDIEERVFCFGPSVTPSGHAYTPTYYLPMWSRGTRYVVVVGAQTCKLCGIVCVLGCQGYLKARARARAMQGSWTRAGPSQLECKKTRAPVGSV